MAQLAAGYIVITTNAAGTENSKPAPREYPERRNKMAQQTQTTQPRSGRNGVAIADTESEPIFFFDGDFRTWAQVQQRAQLNKAIAMHMGN